MKIVFSIPGFDRKSNGLNVFHLLARDFKKLGAEVRIIPWPSVASGFRYEEPAEYRDLYSARFDLSDAIAFFPDAIPPQIVEDLRSKTKHCIWWLCNVPGLLGHERCKFEKGDFLFSYSKLVSDYLPQLYYHSDIAGIPQLKEIKRKRKDADLIVVYTGKGSIHAIPQPISDFINNDGSKVVYISRFFPETKDILYSILIRAKFLISFDPISNLNYEANLFGVPVFLVNQLRPELNLQKDFNIPLHGFFTNVDDFINTVKIGLDVDVIHEEHKKALDGNFNRVKNAYNFLGEWIKVCNDSFLSEFQANVVEMYNKVVEIDLLKLRGSLDLSNGSKKDLSEEDKKYIARCVENPRHFQKEKGLISRLKRSFVKKKERKRASCK